MQNMVTLMAWMYEADGLVPNSELRTILYFAGMNFGSETEDAAKERLSRIAKKNDWYCDWTGNIYRRTHYHSTAHEALVVYKGTAQLKFGGDRVTAIRTAYPGDVIFIPAGVGHKRVWSSTDFTVFGLYPNGQTWDMQWAWQKNYASSRRRIKKVPLPTTCPIFGKDGPLMDLWKK